MKYNIATSMTLLYSVVKTLLPQMHKYGIVSHCLAMGLMKETNICNHKVRIKRWSAFDWHHDVPPTVGSIDEVDVSRGYVEMMV